MIPVKRSTVALLSLLALVATVPMRADDALAEAFAKPLQEARPMIWWHWLNGNVSRDGIEKDLQAMKAAGVGGFQLFDVSMCAPGPLRYGSPEWIDTRAFALKRAQELGLQAGLHVGPGWSEAAGPWVTPEDSMKCLVWTETVVDGGAVDRVLEEPRRVEGLYRDVAVIAVPGDEADSAERALPRPKVDLEGSDLSLAVLVDGDPTTACELPKPFAEKPVMVRLTFPSAVTVNGIECALPLARWGLVARATLEASTDERAFSLVRQFRLLPGSGMTPITAVNFTPVTARYFRLSLLEPTDNILRTGLAEIRLRSTARMEDWGVRSGRMAYGPDTQVAEPAPRPVVGTPADRVLDLSERTDAAGRLRWEAPAGQWIVYRFGYTSTGERNHPAQPEGTGLEVDKMDAAAVRRYVAQSVGRELALEGSPVRTMFADSWEAGAQNWAADFPAQFQRSAGYDLHRWLPVLTGRVIGTSEQSTSFLWDFRQAISRAVATNYYGTLRKEMEARGVTFYVEPYGGPFEMSAAAETGNVPMSEFWITEKEFENLKNISSLAHALGRPLVAAESFTAMDTDANYRLAPADYKTVGDRAFANGLNQVFLHTFVHQPSDAAQPGFTLGFFGSHLNRHETWWPMVNGWTDYLARCQVLLRHGRAVADVAYLRKVESPSQAALRDYGAAGRPSGRDYDFISTADLDGAEVVDGLLTLRSGARYRLLVLPEQRTMQTAVAVRLETLVAAGLQLLGPAPSSNPGLADRETADRELARVRRNLWGDLDGAARTAREAGRGKVYWGRTVDAVLAEAGVAKDFEATAGAGELVFCHRATADRDVYFVANVDVASDAEFTATFRAAAGSVTLWDPLTGTIRATATTRVGERTALPLRLAAKESVFVVFSRNSAPAAVVTPKLATQAEVTGPWTLQLASRGQESAGGVLSELASLSTQPGEAVRNFGGIATYRTRFAVAPGVWTAGQPAELELGRVAVVAEVRVNGRSCGIAWVNPYRVSVGPALRIGENELEIRVATPWANRLIGDATRTGGPDYNNVGEIAVVPEWVLGGVPASAEQRARTFVTYRYFKGDEPLVEAGLLGPVKLLLPGEAAGQLAN